MDLARELNGEIVNADSQQVYRYLDIGTGKPSPEERRQVPHHLIDVVDPDQEFNAALFREKALESAYDIWRRGKRAIVCGGTGLYIKALVHGLFAGPSRDPQIRSSLENEAAQKGLGSLYQRLKEIDPGAVWIHPNDRQRIIRALEIFQLTGKTMSEFQREHGFKESPFDTLKIGLDRERQELYERINRRCEAMIAKGLIEEVQGLLARNYSLRLPPLRSVGYRHAGLVLAGGTSLEDALSLMKRDTRHLAKRQLTWFRADKEIRWFHPEGDRSKIFGAARDFFGRNRL